MKENNNLPIFIGLSIAFGIILGSFFNIRNVGKIYNPSYTTEGGKLSSVLKYIESEYVDDVDADKITEELITDLLDKLDPHSSYLSKDAQQYARETMEGNFVGIGVQFVVKKDTVVVVKVLPDGPSKNAGLRAGDRLLTADKDTIYGKGLNSNDIVSKLKGIEDSQVLVKVYRPGESSLIDFNITRGKVAIKSVPVAFKLTQNLGYIKVDRFAMTTYDEFKTALDSLQNNGIQDLVLDLRGNPGGYMHIADQMADEFLADGKLIVYTKNKKGRQKNSVATSKGSFEKGHIYVLVDENSASASEIVSGALQDNDRGTIIGRRTFGKGLVQQEIDFNDGSAMRLTIARYYTPTGRSIQKPYGNNNYDDEVASRYKSGELFFRDSIKVIDSLKYTTPKGKIVYGGGGITPDVFIPLDTTNSSNYYELNLINNFVYNYVDKNRKELLKYTDANFIEEFKITASILKEFKNYIAPYKFSNQEIVKELLKENFATTLTSDEVYFKLIQLRDSYIEKVKILHQND
ncbi:carboxyl-terminal processing protease [Wenyingzhuangia heitensis]|uniref:Carboxyl-terminal processing protease n=1 Tax=Wenyingzhuangia heitensis TaxID=1487859 RepID=A0ABX0U7W0_9FLAO|nr:S41 family peptidase [Wenyingzhuangia heitensis]NIJ43840.1 carboxyl-terminal processing protease [Wenyingzhuangia heitensis]